MAVAFFIYRNLTFNPKNIFFNNFIFKLELIIQDLHKDIIGDNMFNIKDILNIANKLNIDFSKFSLSDFITGINIELEHGLINPDTNVTDNDLLKTAKIALAHLNEFPDYYNKEYGLPAFEKKLKSINQNK